MKDVMKDGSSFSRKRNFEEKQEIVEDNNHQELEAKLLQQELEERQDRLNAKFETAKDTSILSGVTSGGGMVFLFGIMNTIEYDVDSILALIESVKFEIAGIAAYVNSLLLAYVGLTKAMKDGDIEDSWVVINNFLGETKVEPS